MVVSTPLFAQSANCKTNTIYKQYKCTNLDDMSYAKLQLKVMLRSPKFYSNFNRLKKN